MDQKLTLMIIELMKEKKKLNQKTIKEIILFLIKENG